ncbi:hypothetical protein [Caballeronia sp. LZ016]|uniref:hypothetical protein n=1 Tax=Caballeronia sp. LZ016 TaxID=3038554 RepID=UPI002858916C|nr:hypothetical protein [Caballeronia sp. LZ016]MDR5740423.1 hypothetical protein [Caballeronia sp. LZ016]
MPSVFHDAKHSEASHVLLVDGNRSRLRPSGIKVLLRRGLAVAISVSRYVGERTSAAWSELQTIVSAVRLALTFLP